MEPPRQAPGPAESPDVAPEHLERLARLSRLPSLQLRWPWQSLGALVAFHALAVTVLWASAFPGWRVAVVAASGVAKGAFTLRFARRGTEPADLTTYPPGALRLGLVYLVANAAEVTATGGLKSPLFVAMLMPAMTSLALFGGVPESRVLAGFTTGIILLAGTLPDAWCGPPLSDGVFGALAIATALTTMVVLGTNLVRLRAALRATGQDLARAREDLATHALARARRLEEVGAQVAHELKNPLTAVKALAQVGVAAAAADARASFAAIERDVARMQEIIREYLSFTRPIEELRPERVDLGPLVAEVLAVLSARAERAGVREACHGDAPVTADPRRLKEALLNLVANAIEATPPGGAVEVGVERDDGRARIVIRDTGRGMPPEVLSRVGTPFFTTREFGTGLGVVLARAVFDQHGGDVRYESAPGRGTTVTATLPFEPLAAAGARA
ncbi:MAG TPA: HAMP domain-containing sensor histidine kinase [Anaeromyxobacteraceae bacterium]|nr:HAMP domain-containing sensor histidine kinase [Anaeromyxobacteraceae bacterium]